MPAQRFLSTAAAEGLIEQTREYAQQELSPRASPMEADSTSLRDVFRQLGAMGLLGLPYPREVGGGGQPYEVYLQALEEISGAWASVGLGLSVHIASCFPLYAAGTPQQSNRWLAGMLQGERLGGYCLTETVAGSDPAAMLTRAEVTDGGFSLTGTKTWVTHAGSADFYTVFARTSSHRSRGISCFLVGGTSSGITVRHSGQKLGLRGLTTASVDLDSVHVGADRLIGEEGRGLRLALAALDGGRLGVAAVAVGIAQAALDAAVSFALQRRTFGKPIAEHQGLGFVLADMAAAVTTARAVMLDAARLRDRGMPFTQQAATAKLIATDIAMQVSTDAVQVLGASGLTDEFPVERYMRDAKVLQILEGTNQIQRLVIARHLLR